MLTLAQEFFSWAFFIRIDELIVNAKISVVILDFNMIKVMPLAITRIVMLKFVISFFVFFIFTFSAHTANRAANHTANYSLDDQVNIEQKTNKRSTALRNKQQPRVDTISCPYQNNLQDVEITCFKVYVYENHDNAQSKLINFQIHKFSSLIHKASSQQNSPLFDFGGGGPGADSGFARGEMPFAFSIYRRFSVDIGRDLYLLEARGTGASEPNIGCPAIHQVYLEHWQNKSKRYQLSESLPFSECAQAYAAQGIDLKNYNSYQTARDAAFFLSSLKLPSMNIMGVSYASRYAQSFAKMYPSYTRSLILDSPVFPSIQFEELGDNDYRAFLQLSESIGLMAGRQAAKNFLKDLETWFDESNLRPQEAEITWPQSMLTYLKKQDTNNTSNTQLLSQVNQAKSKIYLDGLDLMHIFFNSLYFKESVFTVPIFFNEMEQGSFEYFSFEIEYYLENQFDPYFSNLLLNSTTCYESFPFADLSKFDESVAKVPAHFQYYAKANMLSILSTCWEIYQAHDKRFTNENKLIKKFLTKSFDLLEKDRHESIKLAPIQGFLRYEHAPLSESIPIRTELPTLLLFGKNDPVIPYLQVSQAKGFFSNSEAVIFPNTSHVTSFEDCGQIVINGFLQDYSINDSERACVSILELASKADIVDPTFLAVSANDELSRFCLLALTDMSCADIPDVEVSEDDDTIKVDIKNAYLHDGNFYWQLRDFVNKTLKQRAQGQKCVEEIYQNTDQSDVLQDISIRCDKRDWWQKQIEKILPFGS